MMGILKEAKVHCTMYKDNSGALELAHLPQICPRTKHINQSFHHFHEHVECQDITIKSTPMDQQKPTSSTSLWLTLPSRVITWQLWDGRAPSLRMEGSVRICAEVCKK